MQIAVVGDYRGHISLAYPGTIPGAVNTLGGGSGLPGGRSADRRQAVAAADRQTGGRRSGRAAPMGAACRHGGQTVGRSAASSGSRQDGQPSASAASRAGAGDTKRAGPRRDTKRAGPQAQHTSHPPPERPAIHQPHRPAGRRRYQTPAPAKIPRRAGPREILNAPARGTGGAAVVLCGFGSPKFL